jgi:hypothetical protein
MNRLAQPITILPPVIGTAEFSILQQPKGADFFAAKQTVHSGTFGTMLHGIIPENATKLVANILSKCLILKGNNPSDNQRYYEWYTNLARLVNFRTTMGGKVNYKGGKATL